MALWGWVRRGGHRIAWKSLVSRSRDIDFEDAGGHGDNQRPRDHAPSFKDKLLGMTNSAKGGSTITELDVEVKDEDVRVGGGKRTVVSVEPVVGKSDSMGVRTVALPTVAARGKVVAADSTLPVGRVGSKVRLGMQGGTCSAHKTRKGDTGVAHSTVADHLAPLLGELDKAADTEKLRVPSPRASTAMDTRDVDWCSNSAFEKLGDMDMQA
ncbi:hypothetical protein V6N13_029474 [Hibiscus sabdariffa]